MRGSRLLSKDSFEHIYTSNGVEQVRRKKKQSLIFFVAIRVLSSLQKLWSNDLATKVKFYFFKKTYGLIS